MDRTLAITEWKVRGGFALTLACLAVVGAVSVVSAVRLDAAVAVVARTQEVIGSAKALLGAVTEAEAEGRGYLITGDEAELTLFHAAAAKIDAELVRLRGLAADELAGRQHLEILTPLIDQGRRHLETLVATRRVAGFESARSALTAVPSRALHAAIKAEVDALVAAESTLLTERQSVASRSHAITNGVIMAGGALTAMVVGLVLYGLRRDVAARMQAERQMRATQEDLEGRVRERTLDLEKSARDMRTEAVARREAQERLRQAYDDLRQSQREALQLERLRALGQLASGIAHDINNTISPVTLYIESLLEDEPGLTANGRRHVVIIRRAIDNVAQTVARMRDFSRQLGPQQTSLQPTDLNDVIQHVVELTRARWSDLPQRRGVVIETRTELAAPLPRILGIESELRDALVNLIFNAVDAMPNGGALTLGTRVVPAKPDRAHLYTDAVCLEVRDEGIGMDEDTHRRCIEPFFTTKGERGSGLGLAMVYGCMQRHGADTEIDSAVGAGTTLRFRFPIPAESFLPAAEPLLPELHAQHILVIDDDPLVAGAVRETLLIDGHRVETAEGGQAGIDAFNAAQARGDAFAVVVTDMGMPHVDGHRVAAAVKATAPQVLVILLTGWGNRVGSGEAPPQIDHVMSKPPSRAALRAVLARGVRAASVSAA